MLEKFSLNHVHPSWLPILSKAIQAVDSSYLKELLQTPNWLPGKQKIFNAFSLPLNQTKYILFGESPYPRASSANGYAFWDQAVTNLWSPSGFSREVNRATSLRNLLKMLLLTRGDLTASDLSQMAIAELDKTYYIKTGNELFTGFLQRGFLLLNASLVFHSAVEVKADAKAWLPFINALLQQLQQEDICLVMLGKIAASISQLPYSAKFKQFIAEHPYNLSFIGNKKVQQFFAPMDLLSLSE